MAAEDNAEDRLSLKQWAYIIGTLLAVAVSVSVYDAWRGNIRNDNYSLRRLWQRLQSPTPGNVRNDFTNYSLAASRVTFAGGNPYSKQETSGRNYKYFPLNAALLGPLTLVPIPIAQGIWTAINVGLLLWCFRLHWAAAQPRRTPLWVWIVSLALAARFISQNLKLGQWNTSVYCLTFAGLIIARKRPWTGALALALAAALKYMPAFFLLYFAAKRQWKALLATTLALAFWVLVAPSLILGPSRHFELLQAFRAKAKDSYGNMTSERSVVGHSLRATIYAYLTPAVKSDDGKGSLINVLDLPPATASFLVQGSMGALLAGVFALSVWRRARRSGVPPDQWSRSGVPPDQWLRSGASTDQWLLEAGVWFLLLLMISPEVRTAHFITTFTPAFALALTALHKASCARTRRIAAWSLGLVAVCLLVCSRSTAGLSVSRTATLYGGYTLVSVILFAASVYVLVADDAAPPPQD